MGKELKPKDDNELVPIDDKTSIRRGLLRKHTNKAGIEMWAYDYWEIFLRGETTRKFKIYEPTDYDRIRKSVNNTNIVFIDIKGWLINKRDIHAISPKRIGYKEIK